MRSLSTSAWEDSLTAPFLRCQPDPHPGGVCFVERLRMARHDASDASTPDSIAPPVDQRAPNSDAGAFNHRPVMVDEVVALFASVPEGIVIDATLGGAGHAIAILEAHPHLTLLGLDRDADAIDAATLRLAAFVDEGRAALRHTRFDALVGAAADAFPGRPIVGVLFDLGVSSPQLDRAERGFSYRQDGPLDMRMDRSTGPTAADLVASLDPATLADVLRNGGEERFAGRIARALVAVRTVGPVTTTGQLADIVRNALPAAARRRPGDPAKRTFQALRLAVNGELEALVGALDRALELVEHGGRIVTLAYHSGEDRLIKARFVEASTGGCLCPPALPCVCGAKPTVRLLNRGARKPSAEEVGINRRAESARLRAVEALNSKENALTGDVTT